MEMKRLSLLLSLSCFVLLADLRGEEAPQSLPRKISWDVVLARAKWNRR